MSTPQGRGDAPDIHAATPADRADQGSADATAGRPATRRVPLDPSEYGGEPVCWLPRVCTECGQLADSEPPTRCPRCGAEIGID